MDFATICWLVVTVVCPLATNVIDTLVGDE